MVVIATTYQYQGGRGDKIDGFIQDVKQTNEMYIVLVEATVGHPHLVRAADELLSSSNNC